MSIKWQAEKIEHWPIDRLKPYERNARRHPDAQIAQIAASIVEFGFTNPILVDPNGVIVAGHGRLAAAKRLGLQHVPVVVLDHLTSAQLRAMTIADNRLAELASWDEELLKFELEDLKAADIDFDLLGFSPADFSSDETTVNKNNQEIQEKFYVLVFCRDDADQRRVLERLVSEGYECRALTS